MAFLGLKKHKDDPPRRRHRKRHASVSRGRRRTAASRRSKSADNHYIRSIQSGLANNLTADWSTYPVQIDTLLRQHLRSIRARSRERVLNDDAGRHFVHMVKTNMVGDTGIRAQSQAVYPDGKPWGDARKAVEAAWQEWGRRDSCEVTGRLSWLGVQNLFAETTATDGETILGVVNTARFSNHGLALQFYDTEQLQLLPVMNAHNGNSIRLGIEFDSWKRPAAYYIQGEEGQYAYNGSAFIRVPAQDIIHAFMTERVNQPRGFPWMVSAMYRMKMLAGYMDSTVINARSSAAKGGYFMQTPNSEGGFPGDGKTDLGGNLDEVEAGKTKILPAGLSFQAFDPTFPQQQFPDFVKAMLHSISMGTRVSYNALSNDYQGASWSSLRQALQEERSSWMALQAWMIDELCEPVWRRWLKQALSTGAIRIGNQALSTYDYELLAPVTWQPRRWPYVDPLKEINAEDKEIERGLSTESEGIRKRGKDPEEVWRERAWEIKRKQEIFDEAGVALVTDEEKGGTPPPTIEEIEEVAAPDRVASITPIRTVEVRERRTNRRAVVYATAQIKKGLFNLEADWEFTAEDIDELSDEPGRYYLSEDAELGEDDTRFSFPTGKMVDGQFTIFKSALDAVQANASDLDDIFDAAGELIGLMESGFAEEGEASEGLDDLIDDVIGTGEADQQDSGDKPSDEPNEEWGMGIGTFGSSHSVPETKGSADE